MEKEILIDASQEKQTRVAIKSDNGVEEYEYENEQKKQLKGNIFLGRISRIEPSLQAAFVDFGRVRHGFLAFNDIQSDYYQIPSEDKEKIKDVEEKIREDLKNTNIEEINKTAKELLPDVKDNSNGSEPQKNEISFDEDDKGKTVVTPPVIAVAVDAESLSVFW